MHRGALRRLRATRGIAFIFQLSGFVVYCIRAGYEARHLRALYARSRCMAALSNSDEQDSDAISFGTMAPGSSSDEQDSDAISFG